MTVKHCVGYLYQPIYGVEMKLLPIQLDVQYINKNQRQNLKFCTCRFGIFLWSRWIRLFFFTQTSINVSPWSLLPFGVYHICVLQRGVHSGRSLITLSSIVEPPRRDRRKRLPPRYYYPDGSGGRLTVIVLRGILHNENVLGHPVWISCYFRKYREILDNFEKSAQ